MNFIAKKSYSLLTEKEQSNQGTLTAPEYTWPPQYNPGNSAVRDRGAAGNQRNTDQRPAEQKAQIRFGSNESATIAPAVRLPPALMNSDSVSRTEPTNDLGKLGVHEPLLTLIRLCVYLTPAAVRVSGADQRAPRRDGRAMIPRFVLPLPASLLLRPIGRRSGREIDASQAERLGRSCLSIARSALALAHSAQVTATNRRTELCILPATPSRGYRMNSFILYIDRHAFHQCPGRRPLSISIPVPLTMLFCFSLDSDRDLELSSY
ncbi:hypothetical protein EVAR_69801_1 [Eumeta japonica]|uniref:Uncharacterized protein n=1 Tax=Eumeta variegata TaxID=151549 RepID=A0A4C1Z1H0_EUMVA|nr:hypothetical protein EVAR_69801_1 [Eumeta japonica]